MDAWPMVEACWGAQWRGFTPEEQAYMTQESERGHPTFIALGHDQFTIWSVEYWRLHLLHARYALMSVRIDDWPGEMSP